MSGETGRGGGGKQSKRENSFRMLLISFLVTGAIVCFNDRKRELSEGICIVQIGSQIRGAAQSV